MNPHYTYLLVDVCSVIVPFLFSFGPKIAFYRQWRYLWLPMLLTAAVFIAWDVVFTRAGIWSFSEKYTLSLRILSLPVEEWLFFLAIPYSCVFIYASLETLLPNKGRDDVGWRIAWPVALLLILIAGIFYFRAYTFWAFAGCGAALLITYFLRKKIPEFKMSRFLLSYAVCLIPFFVVNGILTALPVVSYNNQENLGVRLYTVPVEDVFYGMLLMLGNVCGMEFRKGRAKIKYLL